MNIGVYVENGRLNTLNISNSMINQLAALDQAESHFRSENIKFGIRHRMRSEKTVLNHTQFLGYTKGPDGILQIVPEEAEVVRKIFDLYIQGNGVRKIRRYLEEHGIKTVTGKTEWCTSTIDRMLSNEKYVGEMRMQKTFTADFLTGRREKDEGQLDTYLVENAHEPIIDRETFQLVQHNEGEYQNVKKETSNCRSVQQNAIWISLHHSMDKKYENSLHLKHFFDTIKSHGLPALYAAQIDKAIIWYTFQCLI